MSNTDDGFERRPALWAMVMVLVAVTAPVAQAAQLSTLPTDDPAGPLPILGSTLSPGVSGMWHLEVFDQVTGQAYVGDALPQWGIYGPRQR